MSVDLETLGLTDMIRLRERLGETLAARFERVMVFAVVRPVGVAPDSAGAAAWRAEVGPLLPGHRDEGRWLEVCFATADEAVAALIAVEERLAARQPPLGAQAVAHRGALLTDAALILGETAGLCRRIAHAGPSGDLVLTRAVVSELSSRHRTRCQLIRLPLPDLSLAGIELSTLEWRGESGRPTMVQVMETGAVLRLPEQPIIRFGRQGRPGAPPTSDVVLTLGDADRDHFVSRNHFELRREAEGFYLHQLAEQLTVVDGAQVPRGQRARITPGTVVRLGNVMTICFLEDAKAETLDDASMHTLVPQMIHGKE